MSEFLKNLMDKKDSIEKDIATWYEILNTQGNVGMKSSLVDPEGFPRNDIDLVQVRTARHNVSCLQNDHKSIMKQIQQGLVEYHQQIKQTKTETMDTEETVSTASVETSNVLQPFAYVKDVTNNSPAQIAGLQSDDQILKFGSVSKKNFTNMNSIADVVKHSVGKSVKITVKRTDDKQITLSLLPNTWSGKGLLGCVIVPK